MHSRKILATVAVSLAAVISACSSPHAQLEPVPTAKVQASSSPAAIDDKLSPEEGGSRLGAKLAPLGTKLTAGEWTLKVVEANVRAHDGKANSGTKSLLVTADAVYNGEDYAAVPEDLAWHFSGTDKKIYGLTAVAVSQPEGTELADGQVAAVIPARLKLTFAVDAKAIAGGTLSATTAGTDAYAYADFSVS